MKKLLFILIVFCLGCCPTPTDSEIIKDIELISPDADMIKIELNEESMGHTLWDVRYIEYDDTVFLRLNYPCDGEYSIIYSEVKQNYRRLDKIDSIENLRIIQIEEYQRNKPNSTSVKSPIFKVDNMYGRWAEAPNFDYAEFEINKNYYVVLDKSYPKDANNIYRIHEDTLEVYFPEHKSTMTIISVKSDTLKIRYSQNKSSTYLRMK